MSLRESDIIGKRIHAVYRSPWMTYGNITTCRIYVELDDSLTFELTQGDASDGIKVQAVDLPELLPSIFMAERTDDAKGSKVRDFVWSEAFPSLGLVLENGLVLVLKDSGPHQLEPMLLVPGRDIRRERLHSARLISD